MDSLFNSHLFSQESHQSELKLEVNIDHGPIAGYLQQARPIVSCSLMTLCVFH